MFASQKRSKWSHLQILSSQARVNCVQWRRADFLLGKTWPVVRVRETLGRKFLKTFQNSQNFPEMFKLCFEVNGNMLRVWECWTFIVNHRKFWIEKKKVHFELGRKAFHTCFIGVYWAASIVVEIAITFCQRWLNHL